MIAVESFDVAVIGAGAVGAAIARELARYQLSVALVEAGRDVSIGISKASTAIWHTGFDAQPHSLEARLMRRSYGLMETFMAEAGLPTERTGGLVIAWSAAQQAALPRLLDGARQNQVADARLLTADEVQQLEPHLGPGATGGLLVPGESLLCAYSVPLACATQAVVNGVVLKLSHPIRAIFPGPDSLHALESPAGTVYCRYLVNAAGLHSDEINRLMGHAKFSVTPRRSQLIIFDKPARPLVRHILLPVPTSPTRDALISPTVYGNVLISTTAEDGPPPEAEPAAETTAAGLDFLRAKGRAVLPKLLAENVTASYTGLRAATEHGDYQIFLDTAQRYVCAGGFRASGVSGSLGIAEYVVELLGQAGLVLKLKPEFKPARPPDRGPAGQRPDPSADPRYGEIICQCENVSLGEILDATQAVIPARTLDGLRRRTRVMQGRCQGLNCYAALVQLMAEATRQSPQAFVRAERQRAA